MARTPDRRPGLSVDEDDLLRAEPTEPNNDYAVTRSGGVVTQETWTRNGGNLLKSVDYTRSGGLVTQEDHKIFDTDGTTLVAHLRVVYTRTGGLVTSAARTRIV